MVLEVRADHWADQGVLCTQAHWCRVDRQDQEVLRWLEAGPEIQGVAV